jgi:hypothetical protein
MQKYKDVQLGLMGILAGFIHNILDTITRQVYPNNFFFRFYEVVQEKKADKHNESPGVNARIPPIKVQLKSNCLDDGVCNPFDADSSSSPTEV